MKTRQCLKEPLWMAIRGICDLKGVSGIGSLHFLSGFTSFIFFHLLIHHPRPLLLSTTATTSFFDYYYSFLLRLHSFTSFFNFFSSFFNIFLLLLPPPFLHQMGNLFGKSSSSSSSGQPRGKPDNRVTQHDKAVLDLKLQRDKLTRYQKKVHPIFLPTFQGRMSFICFV